MELPASRFSFSHCSCNGIFSSKRELSKSFEFNKRKLNLFWLLLLHKCPQELHLKSPTFLHSLNEKFYSQWDAVPNVLRKSNLYSIIDETWETLRLICMKDDEWPKKDSDWHLPYLNNMNIHWYVGIPENVYGNWEPATDQMLRLYVFWYTWNWFIQIKFSSRTVIMTMSKDVSPSILISQPINFIKDLKRL